VKIHRKVRIYFLKKQNQLPKNTPKLLFISLGAFFSVPNFYVKVGGGGSV
jgi:hypothetical protein